MLLPALLLGAAFAVCAAPCVGVLLGAILALAADSRTVVRGCILLAAYSLGITVAFVAIGIAFTRAMAAFRWVRDHYGWIRVASGATLVALGLLLFFNRDWWLRVFLNRALEVIGDHLDELLARAGLAVRWRSSPWLPRVATAASRA